MEGCKSHADRLGVPTGVSGETAKKVLITESNRVSEFYRQKDILSIKRLKAIGHEKYGRHGIPYVVFGLDQPDGTAHYALYVTGGKDTIATS